MRPRGAEVFGSDGPAVRSKDNRCGVRQFVGLWSLSHKAWLSHSRFVSAAMIGDGLQLLVLGA